MGNAISELANVRIGEFDNGNTEIGEEALAFKFRRNETFGSRGFVLAVNVLRWRRWTAALRGPEVDGIIRFDERLNTINFIYNVLLLPVAVN